VSADGIVPLRGNGLPLNYNAFYGFGLMGFPAAFCGPIFGYRVGEDTDA
jgi:hypothetical protein